MQIGLLKQVAPCYESFQEEKVCVCFPRSTVLSTAQGDAWSYKEGPLLHLVFGTELQVSFDILQTGPKGFQGV